MDFDARNAPLVKGGRKAREQTAQPGNAEGIVSQVVDIFSDGVRLSATLWRPEGGANSSPRPAILLMHGWGGIRDHVSELQLHRRSCK